MKTVIVCGHWASGKSTAIKELLALWGEENVEFRTDRLEFVECILKDVKQGWEIVDGVDKKKMPRKGLKGEFATLWLGENDVLEGEDLTNPKDVGEVLKRINKEEVEFWLHDNTIGLEARQNLGESIIEGKNDTSGKFRLMEMAVSAFIEPDRERDGQMWYENPFKQTLEYNLQILEEQGVNLKEDVIIFYLNAGYEVREWRNRNREDPVDKEVFARLGKDGGGLTGELEVELRDRGVNLFVFDNDSNEDEDRERFRREVIEKGEGIGLMLELERRGVEGRVLVLGEREI